MKPSTISKDYRVTIPLEIREQFGLKSGQKIMFIPYQGSLSVVVVPSIQEARGRFKKIDLSDFREEIDEERQIPTSIHIVIN